MSDPHAYWRNALKGEFGEVNDGDARPGFYRKRIRSGGPFMPVAIWEHEGKMVALVGANPGARLIDDAGEIWTYCCKYPITEAEYRNVAENGGQWSDIDEAVAEDAERRNDVDADPVETLRDQVDAALERIVEYQTIDSEEKQSKAQSLRARLNEIARQADKVRKEEKEPHLEASRAVDAKFQPIVKSAKGGAEQVAKAMSAFETEKARRADAERREREAERRRQEEEARQAAEAGKPAPEPVTAPEPAPGPEPVRTTVRGGYGRSASVRVVHVATVTDQDKAYMAMREHPELVSLIVKLAQRAVDAGHEIDGVTVEEQRKVA